MFHNTGGYHGSITLWLFRQLVHLQQIHKLLDRPNMICESGFQVRRMFVGRGGKRDTGAAPDIVVPLAVTLAASGPGRERCSLAVENFCPMGPRSTSSPKRRFRLPKRRARPAKRRETTARLLLRRVLGMALLAALGWFGWLTVEINAVAGKDEARPADAIAVFGAAEYGGRPLPVLHARLDHAVELYREQMAPLVITLGGGSDRTRGRPRAAWGAITCWRTAFRMTGSWRRPTR